MKLFDCLDIANACGLETVGEARREISSHAPSLFYYEKISDEIWELYCEMSARGIKPEMTIYEALDIINKQDGSEWKFNEYEG